MVFSFKINLKLFNNESINDQWDLINIFDDSTLDEFMEDSVFAKYVYFIKEENKNIGFVYLMQYQNSNIFNLKYGITKKSLNDNYIYTVLTLIRDKIKNDELNAISIVTSLNKNSIYNNIANLFGNLIYSDGLINYYNINPNCENLEEEKNKILKYLKKH